MSNEIKFNKSLDDLSVCGRVWIDKNDKNWLGLGKVMFLQKIKEHGSISKAASSQKMSYSRAWKLVESINSLSDKPLVIKETGGPKGGGTVLTDEGERILRLYWEICKNFEDFLESQKEILGRF